MNVDLILKVQGGLHVVSIIGIGLDQRSFSTLGPVSDRTGKPPRRRTRHPLQVYSA